MFGEEKRRENFEARAEEPQVDTSDFYMPWH
jgi:hypothetical protein